MLICNTRLNDRQGYAVFTMLIRTKINKVNKVATCSRPLALDNSIRPLIYDGSGTFQPTLIWVLDRSARNGAPINIDDPTSWRLYMGEWGFAYISWVDFCLSSWVPTLFALVIFLWFKHSFKTITNCNHLNKQVISTYTFWLRSKWQKSTQLGRKNSTQLMLTNPRSPIYKPHIDRCPIDFWHQGFLKRI